MGKANTTQVGGDHYQISYQHWDMVCDTNLHYLLGNATKYISRWRYKGGVEDLRKSLHYINKANERGITLPLLKPYKFDKNLSKFCNQFHTDDGILMIFIATCKYDKSIELLSGMIDDIDSGPSLTYTNPDILYFRG